jgi:hypothetical protein
VDIGGPGFINIHIRDERVLEEVNKVAAGLSHITLVLVLVAVIVLPHVLLLRSF